MSPVPKRRRREHCTEHCTAELLPPTTWFSSLTLDDDCCPPLDLGGLPQDCLAVILSFCPPKTVCQLACVSRSWEQAANSDVAWSRVLSWLLRVTAGFPRTAAPHIGFFKQALQGIHSPDKKSCLMVDPESGLPSFQFSAIEHFGFAWLDRKEPTGYWEERVSVPGSHFQSTAYLSRVCWLHVEGDLKLDVTIPAGKYSLSWKVATDPRCKWGSCPSALCTVKDTKTGVTLICEASVDFKRRGVRAQETAPWELFKVGEVVVGGSGVDLHIALDQHENWWKRGMYLDSFVMQMIG